MLAVAGCASLSSPALAAKAARAPAAEKVVGRFSIAGLVRDSAGLPVEELPVRVYSAARPVALDPRLDNGALVLIGEGRTAHDGSYRLKFPVRTPPRRYYLSLYVPGRFDEVRYQRPRRVDLTSRVRPGGAMVLDLRVAFHGAWPKVRELLKKYPKDSARARVIRHYGIAEEIRKDPARPGVEVWWYYARGKNFSFRGDKLEGEKSFPPVLK